MSVFKVDSKFTAILNPDAVKLAPELRELDQKEILYVILVMDYSDSPFRNKPLEERKYLAAKKVFGTEYSDALETPKIKDAMFAYKGLVFDIRKETLDVLKKKALNLQKEFFRDDLSHKEMVDLDKSISFIESRIESISKSIENTEDQELQIKGKAKLSMVEVWQRNQKAQKEFMDRDSDDGI